MPPARNELHARVLHLLPWSKERPGFCSLAVDGDVPAWQDLKLRGREDGHGADGDFCKKRWVHRRKLQAMHRRTSCS